MSRATFPDERAVSWKVLLPQGPEDKVLALGVDGDGLLGLRRTFPRLDVTPANGPYDLVILGDGCGAAIFDPHDIIGLLRDDGVLVAIGKAARGDYHNGIALSLYKSYASLPIEHPRIFVPLDSRRAALDGLSVHSPGSWRAQAALSLAKALRRLGLQWHLRRNVVNFYRRVEADACKGGLLEWLSQSLGYSLTDLVVYAGSESMRRKITALALADEGHANVVVKIADSPHGAEAIRQESEALAALADTPLASHVPRLLLEGQHNGYTIQVQTKASGKRYRQIARLTGDHFQFLYRLTMMSRQEVKVEDTMAWNDLKVAAEDPSYEGMPDYMLAVLNRILSGQCAQMKIVCNRIHGDFAPWNIRANRRQFFVFDWEDSQPLGLPFTDVFHFLYRQASLIGPWHMAGRLLSEMKQAATILSQLTGIPVEQVEISLQIWALREYLAHPSDHIGEVLRQIAGGSW